MRRITVVLALGVLIWVGATPSVPAAAVDARDDQARLVKDIYAGKRSSLTPEFAGRANEGKGPFSKLRGNIYFWAEHPGLGAELWMSDGTAFGTRVVRDINPGKASGREWFSIHRIVRAGRLLFFLANDGKSGTELWTSDGSRDGTKMLRDMAPGEASGDYESLTKVRDELFFMAASKRQGAELWKTDGTRAGTVLVADINPGPLGSYPSWMTSIGGMLYFSAEHTDYGRELWRSDGTRAGTALVKDIAPGTGWSSPEELTKVGETLYFRAGCCAGGQTIDLELWKSDGTSRGTELVKDINPGPTDSSPQSLTALDDEVLFSAFDPAVGRELWKSDGTSAGTVLVKDIYPGPHPNRCAPPAAGCYESISGLMKVGRTIFFTADHPMYGRELWRSDGTTGGTEMVADIRSGTPGSDPWEMSKLGRDLCFSADDGTRGHELWCTRGSAATTQLVADVRSGAEGSLPFGLTTVRKRLLFAADNGAHGWELHEVAAGFDPRQSSKASLFDVPLSGGFLRDGR